jgi:hypothetical protein
MMTVDFKKKRAKEVSKIICPCCLSSFEPSAETVEIGVQIKIKMDEETMWNTYCQDCGKKIQAKGIEFWVDCLDSRIKSTLLVDERKPRKGRVKG